jgi:hypothetical protein
VVHRLTVNIRFIFDARLGPFPCAQGLDLADVPRARPCNKTKYQDTISLLTTKAEFIIACDAGKAILYV